MYVTRRTRLAGSAAGRQALRDRKKRMDLQELMVLGSGAGTLIHS